MSLAEFLSRNLGELVTLTLEHLFLVAVSTGIAILIGVPLGILLTRKPALSKPVLGFANIMQTVPSLALLALMVLVLGGLIGFVPAFLALTLYSILPMLANTITGLRGVDPLLAEAAHGLGMDERQLLIRQDRIAMAS